MLTLLFCNQIQSFCTLARSTKDNVHTVHRKKNICKIKCTYELLTIAQCQAFRFFFLETRLENNFCFARRKIDPRGASLPLQQPTWGLVVVNRHLDQCLGDGTNQRMRLFVDRPWQTQKIFSFTNAAYPPFGAFFGCRRWQHGRDQCTWYW